MKYLITSLPYPYYKTENQEDEMLSSGYAKSWLAMIIISRLLQSVWKLLKISHSTFRAERATFTFWVDKKVCSKCQKWSILTSFWKSEACGQTVLPDNFDATKIGGNAKIEKSNEIFWVILST